MNFLLDPALDAASTPAIWRAAANPSVVVIRQTAPGLLDLHGRKVIAERVEGTVRHLVLAGKQARHRVRVETAIANQTAGYTVPADDCVEFRLAALEAFHSTRRPGRSSTRSSLLCPSAYRRYRLSSLLAILDRLAVGPTMKPTLRQLAEELGHREAASMRAVESKSSSVRRQVQRLVAEARHMSQFGFRDLMLTGAKTR